MNKTKLNQVINLKHKALKAHYKYFDGNITPENSKAEIKAHVYACKYFMKFYQIVKSENSKTLLKFFKSVISYHDLYCTEHTDSKDYSKQEKITDDIMSGKALTVLKDSVYYYKDIVPIINENAHAYFKIHDYDSVGSCGHALDYIHNDLFLDSKVIMETERDVYSPSRFQKFNGSYLLGGSANLLDTYMCLTMFIYGIQNHETDPKEIFKACVPELLKVSEKDSTVPSSFDKDMDKLAKQYQNKSKAKSKK